MLLKQKILWAIELRRQQSRILHLLPNTVCLLYLLPFMAPNQEYLSRMTFTNCLTQTLIDFARFKWLVDNGNLDSSELGGFALSAWVAQLLWSKARLDQFRFEPFE